MNASYKEAATAGLLAEFDVDLLLMRMPLRGRRGNASLGNASGSSDGAKRAPSDTRAQKRGSAERGERRGTGPGRLCPGAGGVRVFPWPAILPPFRQQRL